MADETASPISAAKPPVANPMASATSVHASTLKLKPVIRKPGTATATALKPGIKLPTQTALKPGVRLPTKPGVRLPTKPAIRKPGEAAAAPVAPAAPAAAVPAAPAEPQPVAPSAVEALKGATQKLKGITQQIPAQAILRKTGIIADQELTEAQKQASKSRTARISLSDAIGVAPVKSEVAPMKTIRIKRPVDLQNQAAKPAAEAPAAEVAPIAAPAEEEKTTPDAVTLTQRKTLKIARPGAAGARPTGKFGIKKPGAATAAAAPAAEAGAEGEVSDLPPVGDIPDMPPANAVAMYTNAPASSIPPDRIRDVGTVCNVFSLLFQIAACGVIAFLGYSLIMFSQRPLRCGGTRPDGAQLSTQMFSQIRADRMPQEAVEPEFEVE